MRSVFYFGSAEAAKREASGEKSEGGGGFGGMLKRMSGLPGTGGDEGEDASGGGTVLMKMTTETTKIETKSIDPKLFVVPDDYELVTAE